MGIQMNAITRMISRQAKRLRRVMNDREHSRSAQREAHLSHLAVKLRKERAALKAEMAR